MRAMGGRRSEIEVPAIPKGFATVLGQCVIALLAVTAAVFAFAKSESTPETMLSLGGAVVTAVTLMSGRYAQSYALLRGAKGRGTEDASSTHPAVVVHCCCEHHRSSSA